ncbi:MAG TPA: prolipoprotein diacylglyceryl transferase [Candidatus Limiplasma sp.]|nr:prolipoprotein diacylglyceryl transferase [Candidatus Limiplasma sp.]
MPCTVFGLTCYPYGLTAGIGALCYMAVALLLGKKAKVSTHALLWYGVLGVPLGLVFARLFFCLVNIEYYLFTLAQPLRILAFWEGGYSMAGLLAGLVAAAWLAAKLQKTDFRALLDAAMLPMGVLLFALRLAEGFTGELGVGRQVEVAGRLPFLYVTETMGTMELYRLAVFRYEAVFALAIFGLMLWFVRKPRRAGDPAMLFFALYGAGQVLFESMRDDGHMVLGFIRVQQVLALLAVLIALGMLGRRWRRLHGARATVTAAWALLPLAALIVILMLAPINHVLDLSAHIPLGIALLGMLGLYMAFYLRTRGANRRLIFTWMLALVLVILCVLLEFSMDTSDAILRDYSLLALCCAALFCCPYSLYRALRKQEEA